MYRVDRNNYFKNVKNSVVYTPSRVSKFIFNIVNSRLDKSKLIYDPCVGKGSLLIPFKKAGYKVIASDIKKQGFARTKELNYLMINKSMIKFSRPGLVIMNPPFNKTNIHIPKKYGGRPLLSEVFFQKTLELFGNNIPMVLFTPYGFRLNQSIGSARLNKFITGEYPKICSIISLPKNIFENVLFHSEILLFNFKGLDGHYFYDDLYFKEK